MNKRGVLIAVVALLVIGGGAYALTQNSDESSDTAKSSQTSDHADDGHTHETDAADTSEAVETSTITYTDDGFSPDTITVKSGTTITVKNDSSSALQFSSDPHPSHTTEPELNLSTLSPGKSTTFTANQVGTFGFHNHLNEDETGTLIVTSFKSE